MKKFLYIFLPFIAFCAVSCKKNAAANSSEIAKNSVEKNLKVDTVKLLDSVKITENLSAKFSATVLVFPEITDRNLLDSMYRFQSTVTDFSKSGLQSILQKQKEAYFTSVKQENFQQDFPQEYYDGWEMKLLSSKNNFLQIENLYSSYAGGAHGNFAFEHKVLDLKTRKKMQLLDITTMPAGRLSALLKQNLNVIASGTTDSRGAVPNSEMLLVDVIPATENFYFDEKNLYFHYSPYEIAAYAAGDITIPVPWKDLRGTIQADFADRMNLK